MTKRTGPRMARALRMARGRKPWADIVAWLGQPKQRDLMVKAAQQGQQPLTAIVDLLHTQFGAALDDRATKMFCGTAMAGIMEEESFEPISTGERIPTNVAGFRTGARYVRSLGKQAEPVPHEAEGDDDILLTMLGALDASQRRRLRQMIGPEA